MSSAQSGGKEGELKADREPSSGELYRLRDLVGQVSELLDEMIERQASPGLSMEPEPVSGETRIQADGLPPYKGFDFLAFSQHIPLLGRTLMVLGGAFLLRAFTENEAIPDLLGMLLGLAYAFFWLLRAHGPDESRLSALVHGVAAAIIVYPLLWESTLRFGILSPLWASVALVSVAGAALVLARHRSFPEIAWVHLLAALATCLLLAWETREPVGFVAALIVLGVAVVSVDGETSWALLAWLIAGVANLAVYELSLGPESSFEAGSGALVCLQLALVLLYLGCYAWLVTFRKRSIRPSEIVQTAVVLIVGYRGAVSLVIDATPGWQQALASLSLLLALAGYLLPISAVHRDRWLNFFYFTSLGLIFGVAASSLLLSQPAWGWAPLAVGLAWLAHRVSRRTLSLHAALLLCVAAFSSGLVWLGGYALLASADTPWPPITPVAVFVLAATAVCVWMPARGSHSWGSLIRLPKAIFLVVLALGLGAVILHALRPLWVTSGVADAALLAAARTAVLSVTAVLLALAATRSRRLAAASWLVWPVLGLTALKLVLEDLAHGRPGTLFVAFALFGAALFTVPGMMRRRTTDSAPTA